MTTTSVVVLALLWGVALLPGVWRDHRRSPRSTVDGFNDAMARLAVCDSRSIVAPASGQRVVAYPRRRENPVLARRRLVLARLAAVSGASTLAALVLGGIFTVIAVIAVLLLTAYVAALRAVAVRRQLDARVVALSAEPTRDAAQQQQRRPDPGARRAPDALDEPLFSRAAGGQQR